MRRSSGVFSMRRSAATHQVEGADRAWESAATQERRLDDSGFKSCPHNSGAASVEMIELLLKGFAGARNTLYLEFPWSVVELPAAS
jgi:hypothetical protein